ncbi:MAG: hypothetical protein ACXV2F_04860 [Halobacteriota archaeon]
MIFFDHISSGGVLELDHPEFYSDLLKDRLANCRVQLDIDRKKTPRSHQQNNYLWAAVYPVIAEHNGNSIPEVHESCKQMFLPPRQMSIGEDGDGRRLDCTAHDGRDDGLHRPRDCVGRGIGLSRYDTFRSRIY